MDETHSILNRVKNMYQSSQWCDLEFSLFDQCTGKAVILKAHRLILASSSPVFEALCFGPLAEQGKICVSDIEPDAFEVLLKFLYTDSIKFESAEIASSILYAAKKYLLPNLAALAIKYLMANVTDRNSVDLYNLGVMLEIPDMVDLTYEHIRRRLNYVKDFVNDSHLNSRLIEALVTSPVINSDEVTLVKLAQLWAQQVCDSMNLEKTGENVRNVLVQNNIFQNINWHALTEEDLQDVLPGVLFEDEMSRNSKAAPLVRNPCPMKQAYVHRFIESHMQRQSIREGTTISTAVSVNRTVTLKGIFITAKCTVRNILNSSMCNKYKEQMEITIFKDHDQLLCKKICDDIEYGKSFYVSLGGGIAFRENCAYKILIKLLTPVLDYPYGQLSKITKIPSGLQVKCSEFADFLNPGEFLPAQYLGLITGFEFLY